MVDRYVIANIPNLVDKEAYSAVESYRLTPDGSDWGLRPPITCSTTIASIT